MNWRMKSDIQITSIEIWKKSQFLFYYIFVEKISYYIYCISVSVLSVSVSADMKNAISVFYRYRPIRKLSLSGFIGIGRYEKKLIGHTLLDVHFYVDDLIIRWENFSILVSFKSGTDDNLDDIHSNFLNADISFSPPMIIFKHEFYSVLLEVTFLFFSSFFSNPPWNFLIFYINYTKIHISLSLSLSLSLSFSLSLPEILELIKYNSL